MITCSMFFSNQWLRLSQCALAFFFSLMIRTFPHMFLINPRLLRKQGGLCGFRLLIQSIHVKHFHNLVAVPPLCRVRNLCLSPALYTLGEISQKSSNTLTEWCHSPCFMTHPSLLVPFTRSVQFLYFWAPSQPQLMLVVPSPRNYYFFFIMTSRTATAAQRPNATRKRRASSSKEGAFAHVYSRSSTESLQVNKLTEEIVVNTILCHQLQ